MDLVLVSITGISLALAIVMGVIVFRLLREERLRSEARVALLAAATGGEPPPPDFEHDDVPVEPSIGQTDSGGLFSVPESDPPWPRRAAVAAALAVLVAVAGYGLTRSSVPGAADESQLRRWPLELTGLQHTVQADMVSISGTVSNPAGGVPMANLVVFASVFGADGTLLAQARAPIDYATLAPGDESGFLVKVPVQGRVAKYRVGFRRSDGTAATHVDRRADGPAARNTGGTEGAPWLP